MVVPQGILESQTLELAGVQEACKPVSGKTDTWTVKQRKCSGFRVHAQCECQAESEASDRLSVAAWRPDPTKGRT